VLPATIIVHQIFNILRYLLVCQGVFIFIPLRYCLFHLWKICQHKYFTQIIKKVSSNNQKLSIFVHRLRVFIIFTTSCCQPLTIQEVGGHKELQRDFGSHGEFWDFCGAVRVSHLMENGENKTKFWAFLSFFFLFFFELTTNFYYFNTREPNQYFGENRWLACKI